MKKNKKPQEFKFPSKKVTKKELEIRKQMKEVEEYIDHIIKYPKMLHKPIDAVFGANYRLAKERVALKLNNAHRKGELIPKAEEAKSPIQIVK